MCMMPSSIHPKVHTNQKDQTLSSVCWLVCESTSDRTEFTYPPIYKPSWHSTNVSTLLFCAINFERIVMSFQFLIFAVNHNIYSIAGQLIHAAL
jgi:hypothetical protein